MCFATFFGCIWSNATYIGCDMNDKPQQIAVITGDLVNSAALGAEGIERAMQALADCADVQADWHGAPLHFTRHRGDGWQVVLARPEMVLRSVLAFRAALRAEGAEFDSYMGIGVDRNDKALFPNININLNYESGCAFTESGDALDLVKGKHATIRIVKQHGHWDVATILLADHISNGWTPTQAAAILPMLSPINTPNFSEVARAQGKSRQSITKSLDAAGLVPLTLACRAFEGKAPND